MLKNLFLTVCVFIFLASGCLPHEHSHEHHGHSHDENPAFKYSRTANEKVHTQTERPTLSKSNVLTTQEVWLYAMASTLLISAAPFFILFFVPLDNSGDKQPLLKILLAFASGGLLGDAFLHLIPHATVAVGSEEGHAHSHSHSHDNGEHEHHHDMSVGLWVLAGIVAFLVVEKVVRIIKGTHSHSHHEKKTDTKVGKVKDKSTKNSVEDVKEIKVAGYLNLAADFSHNFTDGLAIGSSYLAGNTIGKSHCHIF